MSVHLVFFSGSISSPLVFVSDFGFLAICMGHACLCELLFTFTWQLLVVVDFGLYSGFFLIVR